MNLFSSGNLALGLRQLKPRVDALGRADLGARFSSIDESYRYMLHYFVEGYSDPQRQKMFDEILSKAWHLENDVERMERVRSDNALSAQYKTIDGRETGTNTLIETLRSTVDDNRKHFDMVSMAFTSIFLGNDWREQDCRLWTAYLLDSNTPSNDAQTLVSAIMLACLYVFDEEKLKTLAYVYMTCDDEIVRQRALVGMMFGYKAYPENQRDGSGIGKGDKSVRNVILQVLDDDNAVADVVSMIMQMFLCTHAEQDDNVIQKEIMPDIIKGNPIKFLKDKGFVEKDDTMDDILNPGASELAMEKMEKGIQRMANMQKAGADIFYKGFSQMKRYPFFYRLVNWFVPFDKHHPDVTSAIPDEEYLSMIERLCSGPVFCSSDKYSFLFALRSLLPSMPESVRKAMAEGTIGLMGDYQPTVIDDKPAFYRRQYLQNLYRFFKLSPQVKMQDVFFERLWLDDFIDNFGASLKSKSADLARFMIRHNLTDEAQKLIKTMRVDEEVWMLKAALCEKMSRDPYDCYCQALRLNPDNVPALKGIARCQLMALSSEAAETYDRLRKLCPDVFGYELSYYQANVMTGKAEDVLNDIYRLDFEHADNPMVKRLLAWTLLCLGRFDKAKELYNRIFRGEYGEVSENDMLSAVDLYYFSGDIKQCVEAVHNYMDAYPLRGTDEENCKSLYNVLLAEFRELRYYFQVNPVDVSLLVDAVVA